MNMETLETHRAVALNMVAYWNGMRVMEMETRNPEVCKFMDGQIAKYEAQAKHLKEQLEAFNQ